MCLFTSPVFAGHNAGVNPPGIQVDNGILFEMPLATGLCYQINDETITQFNWQIATTSCLCPLHSKLKYEINGIHLNSEDYNGLKAIEGTGTGGVYSVLKYPLATAAGG